MSLLKQSVFVPIFGCEFPCFCNGDIRIGKTAFY